MPGSNRLPRVLLPIHCGWPRAHTAGLPIELAVRGAGRSSAAENLVKRNPLTVRFLNRLTGFNHIYTASRPPHAVPGFPTFPNRKRCGNAQACAGPLELVVAHFAIAGERGNRTPPVNNPGSGGARTIWAPAHHQGPAAVPARPDDTPRMVTEQPAAMQAWHGGRVSSSYCSRRDMDRDEAREIDRASPDNARSLTQASSLRVAEIPAKHGIPAFARHFGETRGLLAAVPAPED